MKRLIAVLLVLSLLSGFWAMAEEGPLTVESIYIELPTGSPIAVKISEGQYRIYVPNEADYAALPVRVILSDPAAELTVNGGPFEELTNVLAITDGEEVLTFTATRGEESLSFSVELISTQWIGTMYLTSEDPVNKGRLWVESSPTKSNSAKGSMILVNESCEIVYDGALTQIKGRGNSTWLADKKPYQIKLDKKTDLLESNDDTNISKTWVLLTNHSDHTLLRNKTVYDLSVDMGIDPGVQCRPVNLFYDGEYRGMYLLCEKVEIKSGRVDIQDLEGAFEDANPEIDDFDSLPVEKDITPNGATYFYCPDLKDPEDITGGYLLELDTAARAQAEKCYLVTSRKTHIVVKSPEFCSKAAMEYIASYYQEFEDALYNRGIHPDNGKTLADYADINSLAQCYIVNELTKNPDGYRTSCYFYKDAGDSILMAGPIWDYDLSFGQGWGMFVPFCADPTRFFTLYTNFSGQLYHYGPFRQAVHDIYLNQVSPMVEETVLPRFEEDCQNLYHTALANNLVWGRSTSSFERDCAAVADYIRVRNNWLTEAFATWNGETEEAINPFQDVREGDWYYEAVTEAAGLGLVNGIGFGIFAPQSTATRAQATKILWAISGSSQDAPVSGFADVLETDWYAPAIAWAKENKVVNGYNNGNFGPNDSITRQDLVTIIYRHSGDIQEDISAIGEFSDGGSVSSYAKEAMAWALEKGILTGYNDKTLQPQKNITRAELTAVMVRYYKSSEK